MTIANVPASETLHVSEAAEHLERALGRPVPPRTIYRLVRSGALPAFRLVDGGAWLIARDDLERYLASRRGR